MPEKATDEGSVSRSGLIVGVPAGTGVGAVGEEVGEVGAVVGATVGSSVGAGVGAVGAEVVCESTWLTVTVVPPPPGREISMSSG